MQRSRRVRIVGGMETSNGDPAQDLVGSFVHGASRYEAYEALVRLGEDALPAVREGLRSDNWQVRRWCAICLDRIADAEALEDLVPLLKDPKSQVRLWAVHSLACDHCKADVASQAAHARTRGSASSLR